MRFLFETIVLNVVGRRRTPFAKRGIPLVILSAMRVRAKSYRDGMDAHRRKEIVLAT